jgi:hypothetical protein
VITITITGLDAKKVSPGTPIWSDENGKLIGTTQKTEVTAGELKGDPTYSVLNEMTPSKDIVLDELRLFYNHDLVDPDTVDPLMWLTSPSLDITDNMVLSGFGSFETFSIPDILPDKEFIAQGRLIDPSNGNTLGAFIDAYVAAPAPEPSSLALLVLTLAVSSGWMLFLRLRRRSEARFPTVRV